MCVCVCTVQEMIIRKYSKFKCFQKRHKNLTIFLKERAQSETYVFLLGSERQMA
jgi:hypothetical protein